MKKNHLFICTVFIVMLHFSLLIFYSPLVYGTQSARIIPHGDSKILVNGQEFISEMPLPEGDSLVCRGTCLIQGPDFQLAAHNNAEFSLVQTETGWTLTIKSGRIDFSLQQSANLTIVGPDGTYHAQKVVPASAGGLVKGSITVSGQTTLFAVTEGKLHLAGTAVVLLIEPAAGSFGGTAATATAIGLPVAGAGVAASLGMSGDDQQGKSPNRSPN